MFIAMNRFRIAPGREAEFIEVWRQRDSRLAGVPGFQSFNLLQGASAGQQRGLYLGPPQFEGFEVVL